MPLSALVPPSTDPTPIFSLYRGNFATELLAAAVSHFGASSAGWPRRRGLAWSWPATSASPIGRPPS